MSNWYITHFRPQIEELEQALFQQVQQYPRTAPLFWEMLHYHFDWAADSPQRPTGKRLRPVMALLVAQALRQGSYQHVLPAAAAIELIHNFSLIHDDVMDKSTERRHRPTIWAKWDVNQAINAGDGLYTIGMAALLDLPAQGVSAEKTSAAMRMLLEACLGMVEGQVLDLNFEERSDVSPEEYITMVAYKSGRLIEASAGLGALLSTDDAEVVAAYREFALNLGIAFQVWDDYLGIWGEQQETGKSATSDILNRKKSYPVLYAFQHAEEAAKSRLLESYSQEMLTLADVDKVLAILEGADAATKTRDITEDYYQRALAALDRTGIDNEYQQIIRDLAEFYVRRPY